MRAHLIQVIYFCLSILSTVIIFSPAYAAQEPGITVATRPVELKPHLREFNAVGTAAARQGIELYASVSEDVTRVLFKAQQKVKAGEVLVKLDNREEILALESAKIRLSEAARIMNQYSKALRQNAVPGTDLDAAVAEYRQSKLAVEQAEITLNYREIKAPFAGTLGIPLIEPGDRISDTTRITSLDDRSDLYIDFDVPESLIGALRSDTSQIFSLSTPSWPHQTFEAVIQSLDNRIDPLKRTLRVRLLLQNEQDLFRPGMSFRIHWQIDGRAYPAIPEIALQWGKEGSYIWVLKDFKAVSVPVKVIARQKGSILIDAQVETGDLIVVEGTQRMYEGLEVCTIEGCPDEV